MEPANEMRETQDYLRSEFNKLSVNEQTEVLNDIYCVGDGLQEPADLIEASLTNFHQELERGIFPVYEMALGQNRAYVQDPSFRLMFIRAKKHNVSDAAIQMENFLRHKATYFGFEKVARDITLEDLSTEEVSILLSGLFHVQDDTNRSGRVIIYSFNKMFGKYSAESLIRVMYYIYFNVVIPMPRVQHKGVTSIYYDESTFSNSPNLPELHTLFKTVDFFNSLPLRVSAMHLCLKPVPASLAMQNRVLGFMVKALSRETRARVKLHYGSDVDLQGALRRHGVPDTFPVDPNGIIRKDILNVWFHLHMASDPSSIETFNRMPVKEEGDDLLDDSDISITEDQFMHPMQERALVDSPPAHTGLHGATFNRQVATSQQSLREVKPSNGRDVYLGRGRDIQNYPGNVQFREFLASYHREYDAVPRHERGKIARGLTEVLRGKGVRFFQRNDAKQWVECDSILVEKKVGQLLREFRKKKNKIKGSSS